MTSNRFFAAMLAFTACMASFPLDAFASDFVPSRDPFQPASPGRPSASSRSPAETGSAINTDERLELRAIIDDGKKSLANINGSIVQAGDVWQNYRIESIQGQSVSLSSGGRRFTLMLYEIQPQ